MSINWLDRTIGQLYFNWTLCTTEAQYKEFLKEAEHDFDEWLDKASLARTHHFYNIGEDKETLICVCIDPTRLSHLSSVEIAGLLVHEAVHVYQNEIAYRNEQNPGNEYQAYTIQAIATKLMKAYAEQIE